MVTLPREGSGSHPEGKTLALDGRGRTSIQAAQLCDSPGGSDKLGVLFWVASRTDDKANANMSLETVGASLSVNLDMPGPIKKRRVDFGKREVPGTPVMMNPKTLPAYTRLFCLDDVRLAKVKDAASASST